MQSLFLAAIGDARDKGAAAVEAFAYRYPGGRVVYERFIVHRTVFPHDFLADFGFSVVRLQGPVELARLELGGLVPVLEGTREKVLQALREVSRLSPRPCRGRSRSPRRYPLGVTRCRQEQNRLRRLLRFLGIRRRRTHLVPRVIPDEGPPLTGVREPRRPRPSASGGAVALELPRDLE